MAAKPRASASRRNFLLALGAGGAATAAVIVTRSAPSTVLREQGGHAKRGYHASEHIDNYYRTAKV